MVEIWKTFNLIKRFPLNCLKYSIKTLEQRVKNEIFGFQNQRINNLQYSSLVFSATSKKNSIITNKKYSLTLTHVLAKLKKTESKNNFLLKKIDNVDENSICFLSVLNVSDIEYQKKKKNQSKKFSVPEINETIRSGKNLSCKILKKCEAIFKYDNKTNCMILFNKNGSLHKANLWNNLYCFKNYSKNLGNSEKKATENFLQKQSEETELNYPKKNLTGKQKLKAAVKDYGVTVIIFHVLISLLSLGICYLIVISGFDYSQNVEIEENAATAKTAAKFVVAYAIHKTLAPARIAITLATAPFIVKKLRKMGILKLPK